MEEESLVDTAAAADVVTYWLDKYGQDIDDDRSLLLNRLYLTLRLQFRFRFPESMDLTKPLVQEYRISHSLVNLWWIRIDEEVPRWRKDTVAVAAQRIREPERIACPGRGGRPKAANWEVGKES